MSFLIVNTVWKKFQNMFSILNGILDYLPTYKAFHWRLLEELYEDNVMYMEMRTGMGGVRIFFHLNIRLLIFFKISDHR